MKFFKKTAVFLTIFVFSFPSLSAQGFREEEDLFQQVLIPRQVFLGDSAQLQYSFSTPKDLFSIVPHTQELLSVEISLEAPEFDSLNSCCTVLDSRIVRTGNHYTVSISFIPWKTGLIQFPEFDLADVISGAEYNGGESGSEKFYPVKLQNINIESLASKMNIVSLRSPLAPVTLPGTNYVLWALIAGIVLFLFFIVLFIARLSRIIYKVKLLRQRVSFFRNSIISRLSLLVLSKSRKIKDTDFALSWQRIMRRYLSFRFGINFDSVSSSNIGRKIIEVTGGLLSDVQETAIESVSAFFVRTDYIRFACGSIDSRLLPAEEHEAVFSKNERIVIIKKTMDVIQIFEKEENK